MKMKSLQQVLAQKVHYGTVCTLNILVTVPLKVCPWISQEFCESSATKSWNELNLVSLIYHRDEAIIGTLDLPFKRTVTCFSQVTYFSLSLRVTSPFWTSDTVSFLCCVHSVGWGFSRQVGPICRCRVSKHWSVRTGPGWFLWHLQDAGYKDVRSSLTTATNLIKMEIFSKGYTREWLWNV